MRVMDLVPNWGNTQIPLPDSQILIASRPPTNMDIPHFLWWYDKVNKIMYIATENGYIKD